MATRDINAYQPTHPGLEQAGPAYRRLLVGATEKQDYGFSASHLADLFGAQGMGTIDTDANLSAVSGSTSGASGSWTFAYDSGGVTSWGTDAYQLVTATTSGNKVVGRNYKRYAYGSTNRLVVFKARVAIDTVATSTAIVGLHNSSTDPFTTAPTNGVFFVITNGAIVGRVRGASGTAANTGTLATLTNGTYAELDVKFYNTGTASTSWIEFWVDGVRTGGTAAQVTQLIALNADLYHQLSVQTNAAAARTLLVDYAKAEYDR